MIYSLGVLEEQDIVKKSLRHPPLTVTFNLQLGPITIQANTGLAVDNSGNIAVINAAGGGGGVGLHSSANLVLQGSNAQTVDDLRGPFLNTSAGAGAVLDASVDSFYGKSDHGPVVGLGLGVGFGAGAGAGVTVTTTSVSPIAGPIAGRNSPLTGTSVSPMAGRNCSVN